MSIITLCYTLVIYDYSTIVIFYGYILYYTMVDVIHKDCIKYQL